MFRRPVTLKCLFCCSYLFIVRFTKISKISYESVPIIIYYYFYYYCLIIIFYFKFSLPTFFSVWCKSASGLQARQWKSAPSWQHQQLSHVALSDRDTKVWFVYCSCFQEIKPGGVLNKKNLWESLGDTLSSGKEGKVHAHTEDSGTETFKRLSWSILFYRLNCRRAPLAKDINLWWQVTASMRRFLLTADAVRT